MTSVASFRTVSCTWSRFAAIASGATRERAHAVDVHGLDVVHADLAPELLGHRARLFARTVHRPARVPHDRGALHRLARDAAAVQEADLVVVHVAVVVRQARGLAVALQRARHEVAEHPAVGAEQPERRGRNVVAVRGRGPEVGVVEAEREQVALPADHVERVVRVEERGRAAVALDAHLVLGAAVAVHRLGLGHADHVGVERVVAAQVRVLDEADLAARLDDAGSSCRASAGPRGESLPSAGRDSRRGGTRAGRTRSRTCPRRGARTRARRRRRCARSTASARCAGWPRR